MQITSLIMASLPPSLFSLPFFTLALILISLSPAYSTSRPPLDHDHNNLMKMGIKISLKHVDSDGNFTKFERLQRAMKRGRHRLQKFSEMVLADTDSVITSTLNPGNGEFLMELSIGTPPISFSAILDTGSDLLWTQCKPCQTCFSQPTPVFDPKKSSSFSKIPCSSTLCEALPTSSCGDGCEYLYTYGDYSSTQGVLATETFTFENVSVPKIGFGCGQDNEGSGFSQGGGLVGLGRGPLSLVSQLDEPKFSYCLTSLNGAKPSTLFMGSLATVNSSSGGGGGGGDIQTTPLIRNAAKSSFYYLSLEGITVGKTNLPIKKSTFALNADGSGGLIIDSGTTITYLEESAFALVAKEFASQIKLPVDKSGSTGLDLCFKIPSGANGIEIPALVFHFEGADLDLPGKNYMIADSNMGLMCLTMGRSSGMSVFGNIQQQDMMVLYDLSKEALSFMPTKCVQF